MKTLGIGKAVREAAADRATTWPVRRNYASMIGDPCERFLVYHRTRWADRKPVDGRLQLIFDLGKDVEEIVLKRLKSAGIELYRTGRDQTYIEIPECEISGKIDGMVQDEWTRDMIPAEVKSTSSLNFDKLTTCDDVVATMLSGARYMQRYPAQLLLYMYAMSQRGEKWRQGVWIFFDKTTGAIEDRLIEFDPWMDYCTSLLNKAGRINEHVRNDTLPDRVDDYTHCDRCDYSHICLPDKTVDDRIALVEGMGPLLDQIDELQAQARPMERELKLLNERRKALTDDLPDGKQVILAGDWRCTRGKTRWTYKRVDNG